MELYTLQQHNESITYYFQFSLNQPGFSTWDLRRSTKILVFPQQVSS